MICASLCKEDATFSNVENDMEWAEKGLRNRRKMLNQRISVNSKVTKCLPQYAIQCVIRTISTFQEEALNL